MNDPLSRLRADVDAEISESSDALVPADADLPEELERLLANYYASEPTSQMFTAAVEALSQSAAWPDAPAGRAARSATFQPSARARTVGEALNVPISQARGALVGSLNINADAADLLLDLPAVALLKYPPAVVAAAADGCRRQRGEIFRAIADSSRMSGGYVYPYRPGPEITEPARRADGDNAPLIDLIAWGRGLFDAPPSNL
jgi:hypothetical protein